MKHLTKYDVVFGCGVRVIRELSNGKRLVNEGTCIRIDPVDDWITIIEDGSGDKHTIDIHLSVAMPNVYLYRLAG